ncbi:MAG TPA: hypothetical protein VFG23_08405 [Polyangia bacterium]|nr:hypothetical protein [Polyangia bacterium]
MDYGLLMRRVMAQLALVSQGATQQFSPTPKEKSNASRILSGPALIFASECQNCHAPKGKRRRCESCGALVDVIYASPYWLQEEWHAAGERRRVELLRIALGVLRLARVRVKAPHDKTTLEGRLDIGREIASGEVTATQASERYGFSRQYGYDLRDRAVAEDKRLAEGRERRRYGGTLAERVAIASTPGTQREVAEMYGVSQPSVSKWRVSISLDKSNA